MLGEEVGQLADANVLGAAFGGRRQELGKRQRLLIMFLQHLAETGFGPDGKKRSPFGAASENA